MIEIPLADDSFPDVLNCSTCLLPLQYQTKKDNNFLWQCFKCGKRILVSTENSTNVEEYWSPPR